VAVGPRGEERRGKGRSGLPVKENGPEEKEERRGKGLGPRTRRVGLPARLLFSFSFLLFFSFSKQLNSI
jgi:hypothetical protein